MISKAASGRQYQYWYGLTEIIVARVFITDRCFRIASVDALEGDWGTLVGSVYFLARGLSNRR